jgi:glutamate/tyrosine decarboxylase-like PLP-dependent enzyme
VGCDAVGMTLQVLLEQAARRANRYLDDLPTRSVAPTSDALSRLVDLDGDMGNAPVDPSAVLALLDDVGSPATVASAGPRYFGFVIGGSLPAGLAASWLASTWDQNAGLVAASPVAAAVEEIASKWSLEVLGLPATSAGAFVTGATMANFTGLAAARHAVLAAVGWDVEQDGLTGAPPVAVIVLVDGVADADSWATDAHKWLNVPYDSGLAFVREPAAPRAAMAQSAAYYISGERREPTHYTPETSRRARGVEIWAVLRSLGRTGLADLIERTCALATRFADGLQAAGFEILNDVVLNQVLVSFGTDERTRHVIAAVQQDGTCWCGGTRWHGRDALRISVSNWATTEDDVDQSIAAIARAASATSERPVAGHARG